MIRAHLVLLFAALLAIPAPAADTESNRAGEPNASPATPPPSAPPTLQIATAASISYFENLMVIGGPAEVDEIPGSADYLDAETLETHDYADIHRILRQVPGVTVIEEEGYGLRPNIGMRGSGTERSSKITLLEDGVLIAPAPYAAPAAYYFPTAGRMESIEVRKGSSSIIQGPFTTGGALNLISTSIPYTFGGRVEAEAGTDATWRLHAAAGGTEGRFGWLVETYQLRSDGFKRLDGGGETGFELADYMAKLRFGTDPSAAVQQALELKLGRTEQFGDETYLGLTEADFRADPYRRYRASAADSIDTEHDQIQLRHFIAPAAWWDVTSTVYRNDFFRNWHKLGSVGGVGIASILDDPERYAALLAVVRGEADAADGSLLVRNNRRDYYGRGIQSVIAMRGSWLGAEHSVEIGGRWHEDAEDRFQEDERWSMLGGSLSFVDSLAPGSNANRVSSADAVAMYVQDQIVFGRWWLTPGVRFETIDFTRRDFGGNDPDRTGANLSVRSNGVDAWIPGLGAGFRASDALSLFAGIHKGFAPPGPGASRETEPERSINYEAGFRFNRPGIRSQVVAFFSDYDNLLGRDTLSSGGTGEGDLFNGGAVNLWGLEASAERDLAGMLGTSASVPFRVAYTHTRGEFRSAFETSFADWAPSVERGDELPYLPENQVTTTLGWVVPRASAFLTAAYQSGMRTVAGRGPVEGGAESAMVLDATAKYGLMPRLDLVFQGRNLLDETYIAARRPAGLRPGLPRTFGIGLEWTF
ncbi:MAG TPA: TonB-dependent receptor [Thermoanaerobaculia bacterium]|nr:TonB-dependent receptor [Thermoanaerobaculia bacterium]